MSTHYDEYIALSDYLSEQGIPGGPTILERVQKLLEVNKPSMTVLNLQIMHDALVGRLEPHKVRGEKNAAETLSRLLRYIEQLEQTNAELQQQIKYQ